MRVKNLFFTLSAELLQYRFLIRTSHQRLSDKNGIGTVLLQPLDILSRLHTTFRYEENILRHHFPQPHGVIDIQYLQAVCGKPVIKAVKVRDRYDVEAWLDSSADYLLFDNGMGTGQAFDWSVLGGIDREFFLAGGLQSENLTEAMEVVRPYALDISSGIESNRKKDPEKMRRIMELVEQYRNNTD